MTKMLLASRLFFVALFAVVIFWRGLLPNAVVVTKALTPSNSQALIQPDVQKPLTKVLS